MSMNANSTFKGARNISNVLFVLFGLWLFNWLWAKVAGSPILYCFLSNKQFVAELDGLHSLGLIGLAILTAVKIGNRDKDAASVLFATLIFAGLPAYVEILFNIAPGCHP